MIISFVSVMANQKDMDEPGMAENIAWMEDTAPELLLYSEDELRNMRTYERTVEMVGIAKDLESPVDYLFKFSLENLEGKKIQVLAWKPHHSTVKLVVKNNHYGK